MVMRFESSSTLSNTSADAPRVGLLRGLPLVGTQTRTRTRIIIQSRASPPHLSMPCGKRYRNRDSRRRRLTASAGGPESLGIRRAPDGLNARFFLRFKFWTIPPSFSGDVPSSLQTPCCGRATCCACTATCTSTSSRPPRLTPVRR